MLRVAAAQASRRAALRTAVVRSRQVRQISAGRRYALFARRRFDRLAAATTASLESAAATPALSVVQHGGAAVILYGFYETDVMLLRLWTVSGLICYSVVPNAWRGNVLLAAWGSLFVGLNAYRLVELASERVPVWLDDDEWACYEASGLNRFVAPSCFKRLAAHGQFVDEPAGRVLKEENDPCPNFLVVRSGTVLLSAHGRPLGGGVLGPGGLVGIPDLVQAKLLADSIAEDDPLRPTGSSSATRVKAQAGDKGARVLRWTAKDFRRAVDAEKDPKVQAQLIFYLNQQLLKKLHLRDHGVARKEYSNLLRAALSSGQVEAQDRAALHAFRAKNGLTEGDHADCLEALGWTTEAFAVGARLDLEGTMSALRALLAKAAPRSASTSPMKPAAPVDATAKPDALKAPVPALATAVDADAAAAAAVVAAAAGVKEDERRRVEARQRIAKIVKRAADERAAAPPPPKARPSFLRRLAPSWASPQKRGPSPAPSSRRRALEKDASERTLYGTVRSTTTIGDDADVAQLAAAARKFSAEHRNTTSQSRLSDRARRLFAVRGMNSAPLISVPEAPPSPAPQPTTPADHRRNLLSVFVPPTPEAPARPPPPAFEGFRPDLRRSASDHPSPPAADRPRRSRSS